MISPRLPTHFCLVPHSYDCKLIFLVTGNHFGDESSCLLFIYKSLYSWLFNVISEGLYSRSLSIAREVIWCSQVKTYCLPWTMAKTRKIQLVYSPNLCFLCPMGNSFDAIAIWSFLAGWAGCLVLASFLISSTKCFPAHKRTRRHPQHVRHEARYSFHHLHEKIYFGILKNRWELPLWWLFALSMLRDLFHFYSEPLASHYRSKNE